MRSLPLFAVPITCALVGGSLGSAVPALFRAETPRLDPAPAASALPADAVLDVRIERLAPPPPDQAPSISPLPPCTRGWRLIGAAVVRERPARSAAALQSPAGPAVLGIGESFADRTLTAIDPSQVTLQSADGATCVLAYGEPAEAPPQEAPIVRASDGPQAIDPTLFERALEPGAMAEVLGPVRLLQTAAGVRVYGVRRGSGAEQLGFQNGDTLVSVDGQPVSADVALTLLARFRAGETVELTIERRGERIERSFRLDR